MMGQPARAAGEAWGPGEGVLEGRPVVDTLEKEESSSRYKENAANIPATWLGVTGWFGMALGGFYPGCGGGDTR